MKDVIYVDANDNEIGSGSIKKAVAEGIIRRVSVAILINNKGEVLLQKRGDNVAFPNLWNESTSGHVDVGETYEEAIIREMKEEMGVENVDIKRIDKIFDPGKGSKQYGIRRAFVAVFVGHYNGEVVPNPVEVSDYKWIQLEKLKKLTTEKPEDFTPGSLFVFETFFKATPSS